MCRDVAALRRKEALLQQANEGLLGHKEQLQAANRSLREDVAKLRSDLLAARNRSNTLTVRLRPPIL